jgi:energy-coupling factor transporter ATP-binding protein EcfA2
LSNDEAATATPTTRENHSQPKQLPGVRVEREVHELREDLLRSFADKFGFPLGAKSQATRLPTVLCLGNHSSGKSTFINYLAGATIQDTGVAPTDDGFTLIMYGDKSQTEDGHVVVENPALPFANLQQYGKRFLDHLKLKRRPEEALRHLCLIDSPGLIDNPGAGSDSSRGYDFKAVVRALADNADLIVFFFDPDKPGTTGESLRIFTDSLSDVMYKLLIVFNKVDEFEDVRDFARTYGSLCWNLSRVVRTKDIPHIYCTFVPGHASASARTIDLIDFEKSTEELLQEIANVGGRRQTNLVGALLDTSRQIHVHASIVRQIGLQLLWARAIVWSTGALLFLVAGWLLLYHRENSYGLSVGLLSLVAGAGLVIAANSILRMRLSSLLTKVDSVFREVFSKELLQQQDHRFLEGIWESVKPRTVGFLKAVGPNRVPFSPVWSLRLKKLRHAIENDLPKLLHANQDPG